MKVLERILADAAALDIARVNGPEEEIKEGAIIVATLDDERLRQLWGVRDWYSSLCKEAEKAALDAGESIDGERRKQSWEYMGLAQVANDVFWLELRLQYGLLEKEHVAIYAGWKVAWLEDGCVGCPISCKGATVVILSGSPTILH